jgi:hypothetical protein
VTRYLVPLVLIVALALRVGEVQRTSYQPIFDAGSYMTLASEIAHTGGYSMHDRGAGGSRGPSAYWPPGLPYFLAGIDLLSGHTAPNGAAVHPARLAQAALGTVIVALIWLVALELFGGTIALFALAIAAIYPVLIELSGLIVAENMLTALILAAVWAVLRARHARAPYVWIAAAGLSSGLAMLTHQNAVVILIPLGVAVARLPGAPPTARRFAAPALLVAVAGLTIIPWTIRNAVVLHDFVPISDETGITLRGTYNPSSAAFRPVPYKWRLYNGIAADRGLARQAHTLTEVELDSRLRARALRYVADHPLAPLDVALHNTLRLLELEGPLAWRASAAAEDLPRRTAQIGVISFWLLCALAAIGCGTRAARAAPKWLWATAVLLALSVVLVNAETPRFREPLEPFLILLAACGVDAIVRRFARLIGRAPIRRGLEPAPAGGDRQLVDVSERLT